MLLTQKLDNYIRDNEIVALLMIMRINQWATREQQVISIPQEATEIITEVALKAWKKLIETTHIAKGILFRFY